jgi:hypothetical protein
MLECSHQNSYEKVWKSTCRYYFNFIFPSLFHFVDSGFVTVDIICTETLQSNTDPQHLTLTAPYSFFLTLSLTDCDNPELYLLLSVSAMNCITDE